MPDCFLGELSDVELSESELLLELEELPEEELVQLQFELLVSESLEESLVDDVLSLLFFFLEVFTFRLFASLSQPALWFGVPGDGLLLDLTPSRSSLMSSTLEIT